MGMEGGREEKRKKGRKLKSLGKTKEIYVGDVQIKNTIKHYIQL